MDNSIAEGSQTFEHDLARLINAGRVERQEGLVHADSPTNLLWRLQNDTARVTANKPQEEEAVSNEPSFTEITLDVPAMNRRSFARTGYGDSGFSQSGYSDSKLGGFTDSRLGGG